MTSDHDANNGLNPVILKSYLLIVSCDVKAQNVNLNLQNWLDPCQRINFGNSLAKFMFEKEVKTKKNVPLCYMLNYNNCSWITKFLSNYHWPNMLAERIQF